MADRTTERIVITKENPLVYELRIDFYVNEWVNELVSEWGNEWVSERASEWASEWMWRSEGGREREYFIEHIVPESNMMLTFFKL